MKSQSMYAQRYLCINGILFLFMLLPYTAGAAVYTVDIPVRTLGLGSEFVVDVLVNTEGEILNTFAGTLSYPQEVLEVATIREAGSIVTVWVEHPDPSTAGNITFSGITPGGYPGPIATLFSIVFRAKAEGGGNVSFSNLAALKNDGKGTAVRTTSIPLKFTVTKGSPITTIDTIADDFPPERFRAVVAQDQNAFDGLAVLVFSTHDKISGIDYYEVCEGLFATCVTATSPYILQNQRADSLIIVRAYDNAGNEQTSLVVTPATKKRHASYGALLLITLVLSSALFVKMRRRRA